MNNFHALGVKPFYECLKMLTISQETQFPFDWLAPVNARYIYYWVYPIIVEQSESSIEDLVVYLEKYTLT